MRGVSDIIAVILILLIVAALASLVYSFLSGTVISLEERGTEEVTHITEIVSSCMFVDSMHQNKVYLRNCGDGIITNDTINIYINDEKYDFEMAPSLVNEGELAIISLYVWGLPPGEYELRITNPKTEALAIFEAKLPDSCILALDFDEGEELIAYDKSGYENHGTLENYTAATCWINEACPSWSIGRFGKVLEFDSIGDIVEIPNSLNSEIFNITDEMTVSAWVYPLSMGHTGGSNQIIQRFNWGQQGQNDRIGFFLREGSLGNHRPQFYAANSTHWTQTISGSYTFEEEKWYHITGTVKSNNKIRMYIDGDLKSEVDFIGNLIQRNDRKIIMAFERNDANGVLAYNGTIDSIRIFNKVLKPEETIILRMK